MSDQSRPATGYRLPGVQPHNCQRLPRFHYHHRHRHSLPIRGGATTSTTRRLLLPHLSQQPGPKPLLRPHHPPPTHYLPPPPFLVFISLIVIFALILLIVWLALRPRVPVFRVDSLTLNGLTLSSSSSSQVSGHWSVRFTVVNPNAKLHAYYDEVTAYVYYRVEMLAQNQLSPFDQGTRAQSNLTAELVASNAYVPSPVASTLAGERSQGSVQFNVDFFAVVRFKAGAWRLRRRLLRVLCSNLPVGVSATSTNGTLTVAPKNCVSVL